MALEDYKADMEMCCRCSLCKFIPMELVKGYRYASICPSIARYGFHAYSGGGRVNMAVAMLEKRVDYTDKLLEVLYNCQMCGGCDISCKYVMDMEVLEPIHEFRIRCVEDGRTLPALERVIAGLRATGSMAVQTTAKSGEWADGLDVKDYTKQPTQVIYHAGCRTRSDRNLWKVAKATLVLLQEAGVDVGIAPQHELCCGGRAYQMGYKEDTIRQAEKNLELFKKSGAALLVTSCSECYHAFKVLYEKLGLKIGLDVMHTAEYLDQLIKEGKLNPTRKVKARVTYHDPCHLGRLGEPYVAWKGKEIPGHIRLFDPPKEYRRGTRGVYEPPRDLLKSIPGLELVEMDRTKEYAWCCGAGGGVRETNPNFASWTAQERITEAESTGAQAIITACPGCEQNLNDAVKQIGSKLKVYDLVELLSKAILKGDHQSWL